MSIVPLSPGRCCRQRRGGDRHRRYLERRCHLLIANADAPLSVDYLHFETSDDLAQFADHWRSFPTKLRLPANPRRQMERIYRIPLIVRGYQPATMADIEMARIAYNRDYPRYPQYEGDTGNLP